MFKQYRRGVSRNFDVLASIAAALALSACFSALLIFGALDEAPFATTAGQTGVVTATGKSDKLCGQGDWAAYDVNCGRQILAWSLQGTLLVWASVARRGPLSISWIFAIVCCGEGGRLALLAPNLVTGSPGMLSELRIAFLKVPVDRRFGVV